MNTEARNAYFEKLMNEGNYIGAYHFVRNSTLGDIQVVEYTGVVIQRLVEELSAQAGNKEKQVYYRSLLIWILQDTPGLARIYKEQMRAVFGSKDSAWNMFGKMHDFASTGASGQEFTDRVKRTAETIKEQVEAAAEKIKEGKTEEVVKDFFSFAEKGVKEGMKQFSSVLEGFSKARDEYRKQDEQEKTHQDQDDEESRNAAKDNGPT